MVYAVAGGSDRHNRIAGNMYVALWQSIQDTPCRVYTNDMRLQVENVSYYPDVMGACEPAETENPKVRCDPCLLVEVLSPSTTRTDRGEKLLVYQTIPTLRAYLIVDQDFRRVERHYRDESGSWRRADHVADSVIPVPCPEMELPLPAVYRGL